MKVWGWISLCLAAFVSGVVLDSAITRMPREARAQNDLLRVERCVRLFHARQGRLPRSLGEMRQLLPDVAVNLTNAYGHAIEYSADAGGRHVELHAFGYGGASACVLNTFVRSFDVGGGDLVEQDGRVCSGLNDAEHNAEKLK